MASKVFGSQSPNRPHLVQAGGGLSGEIADLRSDVDDAFSLLESSSLVVKHFGIIPVALVDADGIATTFASVAAPVTLDGDDFTGVLARGTGPALIRHPKRVTLTVGAGGTPAHWTGGNLVFRGLDIDGNAIAETVASAAGAGTTTTVNYFAQLDEVDIPAQADTGAEITLGVAADASGITNFASAATAQKLDTDAEFNQLRVGRRTLDVARRFAFVFNSHAHWITSTITIKGLDALLRPVTTTIAVPNGGNATVNTSVFLRKVLSIDIPAQGGASGTCTVGLIDTELGLDTGPHSGVAAVDIVREASDITGTWAVPGTPGAVALKTTANSGPYGKYTPHTSVAPDGSTSYVLAYLPAAS